MISDSHKTSLLIPSQLPEFIRDDPDYSQFVLFLQAYYKWIEENNNVTDRVKNILNYIDIDDTSDEFLKYFYSEFLKYFPSQTLANKTEVVKIAKQLYQAKGTIASYEYLFRVLYNSSVDIFYTKDVLLKASAGTWYVPRSLRLLTQDVNFLQLSDPKYGSLRIFGETSKSIATIENVIPAGNKTEVFISDIERLFESGEYVHIVDSNNQTHLINGEVLRAKIVGQISQINVNPNYRGLLYQVNDPVSIYGGLSAINGHGAVATVGSTTTGSIQNILVENGGFGYVYSTANNDPGGANTFIQFTNLGPDAATPIASVGSLNPNPNLTGNVTYLPIDYIALKANSNIILGNTSNPVAYNFRANPSANINTRLADAFTFTSFQTYPISSVLVNNGGGGISLTPVITPETLYNTEGDLSQSNLKNYGILAPIQVISGGTGYQVNDTITLLGGSGYGAKGVVTSVGTNGNIINVHYISVNSDSTIYPIGGMGYKPDSLPTPIVNSANGANSVLQVTGVLGDGAKFNPTVNRIGSITSIKISDYGEDYISTANISLKIQDLMVTGLTLTNLPVSGDIVYQGTDVANSVYVATVDTIFIVNPNAVEENAVYSLRVFEYTSKPVYNQSIRVSSKNISMNLTNQISLATLQKTQQYSQISLSSSKYDSANGIVTYGDGTAKASSTYLNGLVLGAGQYLDTSGHPSSFDVLQSTQYNNYTYELTAGIEISKYKTMLLNLLHPTGMQLTGRFAIGSDSNYNYGMIDSEESGHSLPYYTSNTLSYITMVPPGTEILIDSGFVTDSVFQQFDFGYENDPVLEMIDYQTNDEWFSIPNDGSFAAANTVYFESLNGANLANFISTDSTIQFTTGYGDIVYSDVNFVNYVDNYITLKDYTWLTYSNVAIVSGNANSNIINIVSLTGNYDYYNGGNYTNPAHKLVDVVRVGDSVLLPNNIAIVVNNVDYNLNKIYLDSKLANTVNNASMTIGRTYSTSNVQIFNPVIPQYIPEIITDSGITLTTEDGKIILE